MKGLYRVPRGCLPLCGLTKGWGDVTPQGKRLHYTSTHKSTYFSTPWKGGSLTLIGAGLNELFINLFSSKKFINHIIESRDVIVSFRLGGALVKVDSDGSIGVIVFVEAWKLKWLKSEDIKSK